MLPVAGRPILERIVLHLAGYGITRIVLAVNYLADQIEDHFGDGSALGVDIVYLREDPGTPLGTGGPLRLLHDRLGLPSDPVLVMNGDLVSSFSVAALLEHHSTCGAGLTVAVRDYVHDVPFGVVGFDPHDAGRIATLEEKPRWTGAVNAGIYVVQPELLALVPSGVDYPLTDLVRTCLQRDIPVAGWRLEGEWHDVGRPREFAAARGAL